MIVGKKSPLHSSTFKKAKQRRKLALARGFDSYGAVKVGGRLKSMSVRHSPRPS